MYEILLERQAEKDLKRLPADIFTRIISHLRELVENPKPVGCRKIVGTEHDWRIRVGVKLLLLRFFVTGLQPKTDDAS